MTWPIAIIGRLAFLGAALAASAAAADPCKLVPDRGPAPAQVGPGKTFRGKVVYIVDGDGLCVALGPSPSHWAEVRLSDFYAPEANEPGGEAAKAALQRIAFGRTLVCGAEKQSYDRVVAQCTLGGRPLGDLLRAAGVREGGRGR